MNVSSIIKRVLMKPNWIKPVFDDAIYENSKESFSGGALSDSNLMFVFSDSIESNSDRLAQWISNTENSEVFITTDNLVDCFINDSAKTFRVFDHIINYISVCNDKDVYELYSLLQKESEYLISYKTYGTICTVVIMDEDSICIVNAIKSLIEGNGWVMANHNIISNGILALNNITIDEIVKSALFLSGKYGQLLVGNIIELGKKIDG